MRVVTHDREIVVVSTRIVSDPAGFTTHDRHARRVDRLLEVVVDDSLLGRHVMGARYAEGFELDDVYYPGHEFTVSG